MSGDHAMANVQDLHNKPRIGICKTTNWSFAKKETATALAVARHAAETISKGVVGDIKLGKGCNGLTQAQTNIMLSEMSRSLLFERVHFAKKISPLVSKMLSDGSQISYEQYSKDLLMVERAKASVAELFNNEIDILIAPCAIGEAPLIKDGTGDPIFCRDWSMLGLPCININVANGPNGLPVGVQLIAGPGKDRFLLSAARAFALALPDPVLRDQA
jgi:Asp-tRNA(Asn)/Glu-tRNA(Gln) amidotransferase A subunit family amidase